METFVTKYGKVTLYRNEVYIANSFREGKYWDIDSLLELKQYIDPNKNILEIGGHCGTSTIVYAGFLNDSNKVYVYEPQRNMYNLLLINVLQNNLRNKIEAYNNAVFCDIGRANMNIIDMDGGGGIVEKRYSEELNLPCNFGGIGLGKYGEPVQMITMDSMNHENIGFIHCDAQGAENFIFAKGKEFIKKHRPVILFENNEKYGKYLYDNVCRSYPEYAEYSHFSLEDYCINELNYSKVIRRIGGGQDDLLLP